MHRFALSLVCLMLLLMASGCGSDEPTAENKQDMSTTEALGGPFTADELDRFLETMREMPMLSAKGQEGRYAADMDETIKAKLKDMDWDQDRFMYIYSHAGAMMSYTQMERMMDQVADQMSGPQAEQMKAMMGEQLDQQLAAARKDMESEVPASEQELLKDRMAEIVEVFGFDQ